jgi:hypothetical protein
MRAAREFAAYKVDADEIVVRVFDVVTDVDVIICSCGDISNLRRLPSSSVF